MREPLACKPEPRTPRQGRAAVNEVADDGALAVCMCIDGQRRCAVQSRACVRSCAALIPFLQRPAVVGASLDLIHFFVGGFAHISDPERAVWPIEGQAPRIAESPKRKFPDARASARATDCRVECGRVDRACPAGRLGAEFCRTARPGPAPFQAETGHPRLGRAGRRDRNAGLRRNVIPRTPRPFPVTPILIRGG